MSHQRKVLLIEPPYKNKYPPMGLMKLATYFRDRGDDVRFVKMSLRDFAIRELCDEFVKGTNNPELASWDTYEELCKYIRCGKGEFVDSLDIDASQKCDLNACHKRYKDKQFEKYDIICVTTLFTFYWKQTVETINWAKNFLASNGRILVGGIASSILPQKIREHTSPDINVHIGLLDKPGDIDSDSLVIIDELPLDYSILEEIDYTYPAHDAYFGYMTRGCPNKCAFCAVPVLEPNYCAYIGIKDKIERIDQKYGAKRNLLLLDNNVFASDCYDKIIDEIKQCGFGKGAVYKTPNEYDIAYNNIMTPIEKKYEGGQMRWDIVYNNKRGYTKKILKIYDSIQDKLQGEEYAVFCNRRKELGLTHCLFADESSIADFDSVARPMYNKFFRTTVRKRIIDFNQGVDARLVTDQKMKKLAELNIRPLRIAFDHYALKDIYIDAIRTAAKHGIRDLSNYLLYNFRDTPQDLYRRIKINVELCEELGVVIYSFPMKYHPISDPKWFDNRNYIDEPRWNKKFIRAIQAILNSTKGKIGKGKSFFEGAFGKDEKEFDRILWMPEAFIIYRSKYDAQFRAKLQPKYQNGDSDNNDMANEWWTKFCALSEGQLKSAEKVIAENKFEDSDINKVEDGQIKEVLRYYQIKRK